MEPEDVQSLYGESYASRYVDLWQDHDAWSQEAENYVETLGAHLREGVRWLDVGCGTGWFLSQFPGIDRGGIDLSPAMLERARAANPDARFFRQGDIRVDVPEFHDAFDLVSSTGQAWGYVDSLAEVEQIAANMARWTAPDGVLYVQAPDITDLTGLVIPYNFTGETPPHNTTVVTGAIWSYYDEGGEHRDQVWPSLDVWVRWLGQWFRRVEVVTWPHRPPPPFLQHPRKHLEATGKRGPGDDAPTEVVVRPAPDADAGAADEGPEGEEPSAGIDHDALAEVHDQVWAIRRELGELAAAVAARTEASSAQQAEVHDQVWALTRELSELAQVASAPGAAPEPAPAAAPTPPSTAELVRELGRRLRPRRPR